MTFASDTKVCAGVSQCQKKKLKMNYSRIVRGMTQVMALSLVFASACQSPSAHAADPSSKKGSCSCSSDSSSSTASAITVNAKCPIMGGTVDAEGELATYNGKKIGFCCPGCKPKWEAWSVAEKDAFVAAAQQK